MCHKERALGKNLAWGWSWVDTKTKAERMRKKKRYFDLMAEHEVEPDAYILQPVLKYYEARDDYTGSSETILLCNRCVCVISEN